VIIQLVPCNVDVIVGGVPDLPADFVNQLRYRPVEPLPGDNCTADPDTIRPGRDFHLAVGLRIKRVGFLNDAVCDLVTEFVGMTG